MNNKTLKLNGNYEIVTTDENFNFSEILEEIERTSFLDIVTFNFSIEKNYLLNVIKKCEVSDGITIISNLPGRFDKYYNNYWKRKGKEKIESYLKKLEPEDFVSNAKIFFNFDNHSKIYLTGNVGYIGSGNFSDDSKNNIETGVIIRNSKDICLIRENLVFNIKKNSIRYYGSQIENYKSMFKKIIIELDKVKNDLLEAICEFEDDGPGGKHYLIKTDTDIPENITENLKMIITTLKDIILNGKIDLENKIFMEYYVAFENLEKNLYISLDKIKEFNHTEKSMEYLQDMNFTEEECTKFSEIACQKAFDDLSEIEGEILDSRKTLWKSICDIQELITPTLDLIENYIFNQDKIDNTNL